MDKVKEVDYLVDTLKDWIVNLCSVVIFITAAEMLLPKNNIKKYSRFAFGLILISVLISPVLKLFDSKYNVNTYSQKAVSYFNDKEYSSDLNSYKDKSEQDTLRVFEKNLEKLCEEDLKQKFNRYNFKVKASAGYDKDNTSIVIKSLNVDVSNGGIESIKKVDISIGQKYRVSGSTTGESVQIKQFLNNELNIPQEIITVSDGR